MTGYSITYDRRLEYDAGKPGITVPVVLRLGEAAASTSAKLDTGSSFCVFERFLGEDLGIEIEKGHLQKISTVMGSFRAYGHYVTLDVAGFLLDAMIYFAADDSFTRNVLGRHGFLQQMPVGLNDYVGELYLGTYTNADEVQ